MNYSQASPEQQRLLRKIHEIHFGRMKGLVFSHGDPVLEPGPKVRRNIKLGSQTPKPEWVEANFELKQEQENLISYLKHARNGVIELIEIRHGLPAEMSVAEVA